MIFAYIDPGSGYTIFTLGGWLLTALLGFLGIFPFIFKKGFGFIKNNWKLFLIIISITIVSGIIIWGAKKMFKKENVFDKKIIIVGFDGLSPDIIEPMMQQGKLPNFSRLRANGSYSKLSTTNPSQSPVAWSGFATGQNPGKNGLFDFIIRDPNTYKLDLSLSNIKNFRPNRVIKSKCFWQYASSKKVPSVIIACPVTFPPDKIYGKMLSGMGVPDILGTEGTFTFYTTEDINTEKVTGGKVSRIKKSPYMILNLIGPKIASLNAKDNKNIQVPFSVTIKEDSSIEIQYQNNQFRLEPGRWSSWKEVVFKISPFKKIKGIFKFYLVESQPGFKLYISPINFDPRDPFFKISYPTDYSKELAQNIGLYHTQGMPMDTWAVNEKRLSEDALLEQMNEDLKEKKSMLDFELNRLKKGILFSYFETSDIAQHMFWRYTDKDHPLYEDTLKQDYKDTIRSWYVKMDSILGDVLGAISNDDILIVLSDHGFNTFRRAVHLNSWLKENGYLKLKDPSQKSGGELLMDIDWSNTKAYAIGFGGIYINQEGRERYGIVKPGQETGLLKKELAEKLKEWHDDKYNKKVINNVYTREGIFRGPYTKNAPDLYIGFNIGYRASWQTALGAVPENTMEDNLKKWSGDHLFDPELIPGIIMSNKKIIKKSPSIYDIVPTLLKAMGFSEKELKAADLDGEILF
ncbi:MAG: alkaline phosphatase family protein [Candidatus Omnitrophica bacterium]|nr:alkaline phosphatase family protein [Candidatus Omnitrophota bacterium]